MPINIATGEVSLEFDDIEVLGRVPLQWNASYRTGLLGQVHSPLGHGWFGQAFCTLRRLQNGFAHTTSRGAQEFFEDPDGVVAKGGTVRNLGAYLEVSRDRTRYVVRSWNVDTGDIRCLCFDASEDYGDDRPLVAIEDVSGDGTDLVWEPSATGRRLVAMRQRVERRELRLRYDQAGWIERLDLCGPDGREHRLVTYEHDKLGHLTRIVDAAKFADRFEYDKQSRVTREVIKDGGVFHYRYDDLGRCVLHTGLSHYNERRLRFLAPIGVTEVTDSGGNKTTYEHLPSGQIVAETDQLGGRRITHFDEHGRTRVKIDANGGATTYGYDAVGNRSLIVDALGQKTQIRFNAHHQPVEMTDASGNTWARGYDERNRLIGVQDPLGARWLYEYDRSGNLRKISNPLGAEREFVFRAGVLESITDWAGAASHFQWDDFGRVTQRTGPNGETTQFSYNTTGKPTQVHLADDSRISIAYDHAGNMTHYVDSAGRDTRWRFGPCGRLLERVDAVGGTLRYEWGSERGHLSKVFNEKGETYSFERDAMGRVSAVSSFDGARRETQYDAVGNTVAFVNASGEKVSLTRDLLGRVVAMSSSDGDQLQFCYDPLNRLVEAQSPDTAVAFERDAVGRVTRETQGRRWVRNQYNAAGGLIAKETSEGHHASYGLDPNGRPLRLAVGGTSLRFEYDGNGREIGRQLGANALLEHRYDSLGRLVEQRVRRPSAHQADDFSGTTIRRRYNYGANTSLERVEDTYSGSIDYAYDPADRLVAALRNPGLGERFEYDSCGNITRMGNEEGRDEIMIYGPGNRLVRQGTTCYQYDADGRRTKKIEDADGPSPKIWSYEWSALDRLKAVTRPDGEVWRYRYDALARRIGKDRVGGVSREYLWDGDVVVQEIDEVGTRRSWMWASDQYMPVATVQSGKLYTVLNDHLGTPVELLDERGETVHRCTLDSWGFRGAESGGARNSGFVCDIRFQGQWADDESGLSYNFHRFYDGKCGRYVSPDPIGLLGGTNEFQYPTNPVRAIDPFGLCPELTPASGKEMLREAVGILKVTPPAERASMARCLLGQVQSKATGDPWRASEMPAAGGGRAWMGDTHTLVVDGQGNVFSGPHVGGNTQFGSVGGQLGVTNWSGLKQLF